MRQDRSAWERDCKGRSACRSARHRNAGDERLRGRSAHPRREAGRADVIDRLYRMGSGAGQADREERWIRSSFDQAIGYRGPRKGPECAVSTAGLKRTPIAEPYRAPKLIGGFRISAGSRVSCFVMQDVRSRIHTTVDLCLETD